MTSMDKYFQSKQPTYPDGTPFLGFKVPAAQTFTSYAPSSDIEAHISKVSGLDGWKKRGLLQSESGSNLTKKLHDKKIKSSLSNLKIPSYHTSEACQRDEDCDKDQVCYLFNDNVFGPQQGPVCSKVVYPEKDLGNVHNNGIPLRQFSNYCENDSDCKGIDEFTGKPKVNMKCNFNYKGSDQKENIGMCQVHYKSEGKNFFLQDPPGWKAPLEEELQECKENIDCGSNGVNGWTRCVPTDSGKSYCLWVGHSGTPVPKIKDEGKITYDEEKKRRENQFPGSEVDPEYEKKESFHPVPMSVNRFK